LKKGQFRNASSWWARLTVNPGEEQRVGPSVVSIVVNYRGLEDTIGCLRSLLASECPRHEIVAVDNGSEPEEASAIRSAVGPLVHVVRSDRNLGYGGGANLGLRWAVAAGAEYAWVLNNDTSVSVDTLAKLTAAMDREPSYGAISPEIAGPTGPDAPRGVWFAGGTASLGRGITGHRHDWLPDGQMIVPTGYVTGCAMLLRCEALAAVGLFWERLFLYWEDVDLSLRLRSAGWLLGVLPGTRIYHRGHSGVVSKIAQYQYHQNAILVARRHKGRAVALAALVSLSWRVTRRLLACVLRGYRPFPVSETRGLLSGASALGRSSAAWRSDSDAGGS
jgi:GT2 family glycosyltransferase